LQGFPTVQRHQVIAYLEGELELMTPSIHHERMKSHLARLLAAYAEERGIELQAYGSWTVRSEPRARGVEADECYVIGVPASEPARPDIAIEVVWTSGGVDKLEVYRGLGVPEVWVWQNGACASTCCTGTPTRPAPAAPCFPDWTPRSSSTAWRSRARPRPSLPYGERCGGHDRSAHRAGPPGRPCEVSL
jgi:hypothetical protein